MTAQEVFQVLEEENDQLQLEKLALQEQVLEMSNFIDSMRDSFLDAERVKTTSSVIINKVEQDYKDLLFKYNKLQLDFNILLQQSKADIDMNQVLEVYKQNTDLQSENERKSKEISILNDKIFDLSQQCEQYQADIVLKNKEIVLFKMKHQKSESALKSIFPKIDEVIAQNLDLRQEIQTLCQDNVALKQKIFQIEHEGYAGRIEQIYCQCLKKNIPENNELITQTIMLSNIVGDLCDVEKSLLFPGYLQAFIQLLGYKSWLHNKIGYFEQQAYVILLKKQNNCLDTITSEQENVIFNLIDLHIVFDFIRHIQFLILSSVDNFTLISQVNDILKTLKLENLRTVILQIIQVLKRKNCCNIYPQDIFLPVDIEFEFSESYNELLISPHYLIDKIGPYLLLLGKLTVDKFDSFQKIGDFASMFAQLGFENVQTQILSLIFKNIYAHDAAGLKKTILTLEKETENQQKIVNSLQEENRKLAIIVQKFQFLQQQKPDSSHSQLPQTQFQRSDIDAFLKSLTSIEDDLVIQSFELTQQLISQTKYEVQVPKFQKNFIPLPIGPTAFDYYSQRLQAQQ